MPSLGERLGGRPFGILCISTFLCFLSFQVLLPVVPIYATSLGGREVHVGLIVGMFAFSAMLFRPIAGQLADRIGRRPLVLAGLAIFAAASLAYSAVSGLVALLALRLFHGVGMGLGPTAATVMVADLAPPERRGAAMGLFGVMTTAGLAIGPYLGIELMRRFGFTAPFVVAASAAVGALIVAWALPETRPPPASADGAQTANGDILAGPLPRPRAARLLTRLFSVGAVYPSLLVLTLCFSYGGVVSFLPLFAQRQELGNPGLFFTAFALSVIVVRARAGSLADRVGRRFVAAPALALAGLALIVLGLGTSPRWLIGAAVLYGIGFGAGQPALMAMTVDRVPPEERGRAMGTVFTALELGISGGSVLLGLCAARFGYQVMWGVAAAIAWLGALAATRQIGRPRG